MVEWVPNKPKQLKGYGEFQILLQPSACLQYYDNIYTSDDVKTDLLAHGLWNIRIQDRFKYLEWNF